MTVKGLSLWFGALLALSLYSRCSALELRAGRCSLDGNRIVPVYRVDLMSRSEVLESFCCVRCALEWPAVPAEATWRVHDEITGRPLAAERACFVESSVVTVASRRDRTHCFASWPDAMEHVAKYGGERIPDPFARRTGGEGDEGAAEGVEGAGRPEQDGDQDG